MRRFVTLAFVLLLCSILPAAAESEADLKAAYQATTRAAAAAPADYAANWKAAEASREYGDYLVENEVAGWKETARAVAKDGMKYGEIAFKLNPSGVEGWYWYATSVGTYSDCVSIITALAEGLKNKTQMGFENSYKFDKTYKDGGPILGLGRFWQVLPGIAGQDRKKAEKLFDEYMAMYGTNPVASSNAWYYRGQLYKDTGRAAQARTDLQKAASMGNRNAQKLLAELK